MKDNDKSRSEVIISFLSLESVLSVEMISEVCANYCKVMSYKLFMCVCMRACMRVLVCVGGLM